VQVTGAFDGALVSLLPESLKYICHNGAGYDNIDVDACTQRGSTLAEFYLVNMLKGVGIAISSTPIAVDDATADIAIFLILGALRQVTIPMTAIRDGHFRGKTPIGHDPKHKTLGILGMGGIGRVSMHQHMNCLFPF
jgi:glyoxylate reductase